MLSPWASAAIGWLAPSAFAFEPYPVTDAEILALSRLENEALWLAVKRSGKARARYARTAVGARARRMARMSAVVVAAERTLEREGVGGGTTLAEHYAATEGRARALAAGQAMAVLLDDLSPGWRERTEPLDVLLDEATEGERSIPLYDDIQSAQEETRALEDWINKEQTSYLIRPGYTVTLNTSMASKNTDPFSAYPLEDHWVLYPSDVRLEGPGGTLVVEGHGAWVGPDEIRVSGLVLDDLRLDHEGPELVLTGPGIELRLRGAVVQGQGNGMVVDVVPGAVVDADPAAFALFALATAAGHEVVPKLLIPRTTPDALLRGRVKSFGEACTTEIAAFQELAKLDHPWIEGMLAQTVILGPPPTFEPDRDAEDFALAADRDGRFAGLPDLLRSFWSCAGLSTSWGKEQAAYVELGQQALALAAEPLARARRIETGHWPTVRIVPNLLDRPGRGYATSWKDEVTVFLGPRFGPMGKDGPDPATVVLQAMHHSVDAEVRGRPCPAFDAAYAAASTVPGVAEAWPTADAWLAEAVVRGMALRAGVVPLGMSVEEATKDWSAHGFALVPGIAAGLQRVAPGVWLDQQCGER